MTAGPRAARPDRAAAAGRRVGLAGAAVVGVAFGMARWVYGLTLPAVREAFGLSEVALGLVAGGTFAGFLLGLVLATPLAARRGPRAPTTVGGVCGAVGGAAVALAPSAGVLAAGAVAVGSAAGWVWAPYSDIVGAVAPPAARPRLLAAITTGTAAGLVLVGPLALLGDALGTWRLVWAGTGLAAALAALLNLRWVPRLPATPGRDGVADLRRVARRPVLRWPVALGAAYGTSTVVYFTYATDAAARSGLGTAAGPIVYAVIGLVGLVGLATGRGAARLGAGRLGAAAIGAVALALVLLGTLPGTTAGVLVSGVVFGAGYMVGAAVLAVWTAELAPDRPAAAFSAALVAGALGSIVAPVLVGALTAAVGRPVLLVATGALTAAVAVGVATRGPAPVRNGT